MEGLKWKEDKEEDLRSYWVPLGKIEGNGNRKRKHYVALCIEIALEGAVDLP
jgi:hypothetical protein